MVLESFRFWSLRWDLGADMIYDGYERIWNASRLDGFDARHLEQGLDGRGEGLNI